MSASDKHVHPTSYGQTGAAVYDGDGGHIHATPFGPSVLVSAAENTTDHIHVVTGFPQIEFGTPEPVPPRAIPTNAAALVIEWAGDGDVKLTVIGAEAPQGRADDGNATAMAFHAMALMLAALKE